MNKFFGAVIFACGAIATNASDLVPGSRSEMPGGVYYYPEQWNSNQWERDIKRIKELGFDFIHMGEFAWSRMEPRDSVFDFSWLDKCVDLARENNLKVVMCTPSPTPPAWLTEKHPEVLVVSDTGKTINHGMRLNCNGTNPIYQHYVGRIISQLADRYGNDPFVIGWQLDNEPHFEGLYDYSDHAERGFREWLKDKYGTIEALNKAWGGAFWSFDYNNFEQIKLPNKENHNSNPHAFIDFKRYNADAIADALKFQYDTLKSKISPSQWVTTNFAYYGFLPSVDPFRSRGNLDFASYTMYPMNTFLEYPEGKYGYRLGSGMEMAFQAEMIKSVEGRTGVMELQPGQINWGSWNSMPLPGAVRMWIWHSYGLGDDFVCTYRYRQPLYGAEQFHKGIMEPDGVTLSPGGKEFVEAVNEIGKLKKKDTEVPDGVSSRKTAFLWKHDNLFSTQHTQVRGDWNMWAPYLGLYKKLKTLGASVDFISETDDFDAKKHPFMIMAAYEMADSGLADKLKQYVESGGNLLITYRSGMKDNNSHLHEASYQAPIATLAGVKVTGFDQLPANDKAKVKFGDKDYEWYAWGDMLQPAKGTEIWGEYSDQFYAGTPCITYRKEGEGSVGYLGVLSSNLELEEAMLRKFYTEGGADILDLPDYFFVEYRDGRYIAVNYTSEDVVAPATDKAKFVVGSRLVPPGGVAVWEQ